MQTCIIHLIRDTFRLTSRKYWDELERDVKPVYTAVNATAVRAAFDDPADEWRPRYPAVIRLWDNAWAEFIPFQEHVLTHDTPGRGMSPSSRWLSALKRGRTSSTKPGGPWHRATVHATWGCAPVRTA